MESSRTTEMWDVKMRIGALVTAVCPLSRSATNHPSTAIVRRKTDGNYRIEHVGGRGKSRNMSLIREEVIQERRVLTYLVDHFAHESQIDLCRIYSIQPVLCRCLVVALYRCILSDG